MIATVALIAATLTSRPILVVNAGDDAIFTLRVGHFEPADWSDDILGFSDVIDVSRGRVIRVPYDPGACSYDLQATYRNGAVVVKHNVNLCTVDRIDFKD
jgi:hypothetical protein